VALDRYSELRPLAYPFMASAFIGDGDVGDGSPARGFSTLDFMAETRSYGRADSKAAGGGEGEDQGAVGLP
jgi:hypothetical protein